MVAQECPADVRGPISADVRQDPLRVQGPGGNTSIKDGDIMWIKASGTELADAETKDIFVPVSRPQAMAEALGHAGNGSCKTTVLDPANKLRPSIETTFHAALDWPVVAHTHSVATLVHVISDAGREAAKEKLAGLPVAFVPYAKPGLPLTQEILRKATPATQIFVLENHGLVICGTNVAKAAALTEEVEARLQMPSITPAKVLPTQPPPEGRIWAHESWIAQDTRAMSLATAGSYYPDHVVFLGPALPKSDIDHSRPAILVPGEGIALRADATSSQCAMLTCLSDILCRLPPSWEPRAISAQAEAELLNWDAEKYRQALAARS
ncbi:class II aldolase/adducin family protein [Yoonia algicola]|uniref:Class II aldolase/adducin family protein n=1 Tax=Yoonia algicola TaxID=3137368 RepID=A0AAN0M3I8_9RHOB